MTTGKALLEPRWDCGECGQNVAVGEFHTYVHCVLHKAGIKLSDYGLELVAANPPAATEEERE